jgi:uncharacterized membrane protein YcaP (DUF421 family)
MNTINLIFGEGDQLTALQIGARSFVMFFIALILIRIGGVRIFAKKSSFDDILVIMLGAILSRGVVGATPFWHTVAAAAVMIALHRLVSWLCIKNTKVEAVVKGQSVVLYSNGQILRRNLVTCSLSENDLLTSLRLETSKTTFDDVATAFMESNGRISFILKENQQ